LKGGGKEIPGCGQRHNSHAASEISHANPMTPLACAGGAPPGDQAPNRKTRKQDGHRDKIFLSVYFPTFLSCFFQILTCISFADISPHHNLLMFS
jgi:hypothetical protein